MGDFSTDSDEVETCEPLTIMETNFILLKNEIMHTLYQCSNCVVHCCFVLYQTTTESRNKQINKFDKWEQKTCTLLWIPNMFLYDVSIKLLK